MQVIILPDPSCPNSLSAVQHVVDSLSHVGQIVVEQNTTKAGVCYGESGTISWLIMDSSEHEETAAEMIRVAAQRIGSCRVCNCQDLAHRSLPLKAILKWGQDFIESVCLGKHHVPEPQVWQALQQLERLNTVVFWNFDQQDRTSRCMDHDGELFNMAIAVRSAAQRYVIPANKSLRIECGFSVANLEPAAATECKTFLHTAIQEVLPAGCTVVSVEYTSLVDHDCYNGYGRQCLSTAFWLVLVHPRKLTA